MNCIPLQADSYPADSGTAYTRIRVPAIPNSLFERNYLFTRGYPVFSSHFAFKSHVYMYTILEVLTREETADSLFHRASINYSRAPLREYRKYLLDLRSVPSFLRREELNPAGVLPTGSSKLLQFKAIRLILTRAIFSNLRAKLSQFRYSLSRRFIPNSSSSKCNSFREMKRPIRSGKLKYKYEVLTFNKLLCNLC